MIIGISGYWPSTWVVTGTMGLMLASSGTVTTGLRTRTSTSAAALSSLSLLKKLRYSCEGKIALAIYVLVAEIMRKFMCAEDNLYG